MNLFGPEMLIVLAVVALLFGSTKIPQFARSLGSAKSEFERGRDELTKVTHVTPVVDGEPVVVVEHVESTS